MRDSVFVCVFYENGNAVAHKAGSTRHFEFPELRAAVELPDESTDDFTSEFQRAFDNFTEVMAGFQEFMPLLMSISPVLSPPQAEVFVPFLLTNGTVVEETEERRIFQLTIAKFVEFQHLQDMLEMARQSARELPRMLMTGLISSLDYHLAAIYRTIIRAIPGIVLESERKISTSEVLSLASIDELKTRLVEQEVESVARKSFEDQVNWVEKVIKLDSIRKNFDRWPVLIEVIERRNLFAHNGGFVNDRYIENVLRNGNSTGEVEVGKELHADRDYYNAAVSVVTEFGITLTQIVWRKLFAAESSLADTAINRYTYKLIERGHYEDAKRLLQTFHKWRGISSDEIRRMMIVNLANTKRLTGDMAGALEVLNSEDWSAVGRKFLVSVEAVRGNAVAVIALMKQMGSAGDLTAEDYESWPVFYGIREDERFIASFMEVFGKSFSPKPEKRSIMAAYFEQIEKLLKNDGTENLPSDASACVSEA